MRYPITLLLFLFVCTCVPAQSLLEPLPLELQRMDHQQTAMLVLGGWAVTNIGVGLIGRANTTGATRRFHEMNAIWNVVNLGIAGFGYYTALREPAAATALGALTADVSFQKVLLFNAGLDVGYVLGGLYLTERARRPDADGDQLKGYGRAVMLQGGFLLAFDLVNYFIATGRNDGYRLLISPAAEGLGLTLTF